MSSHLVQSYTHFQRQGVDMVSGFLQRNGQLNHKDSKILLNQDNQDDQRNILSPRQKQKDGTQDRDHSLKKRVKKWIYLIITFKIKVLIIVM